MPFTNDDKATIKAIRQEKGLAAKRICAKFPNKHWAVSSVKDLLRKIDTVDSIARKPGSGRPRSVRIPSNIERVAHLICSQEDAPGTNKSLAEIERITGISESSVRRIEQYILIIRKWQIC